VWGFTLYALLLSIIALGPILGFFIYKADFKTELWVVFTLGGVIWILALIARTPLLLLQSLFQLEYVER